MPELQRLHLPLARLPRTRASEGGRKDEVIDFRSISTKTIFNFVSNRGFFKKKAGKKKKIKVLDASSTENKAREDG